MPRIDPLSLLKCLSILLGPNGGIKSSDEVSRIANLMTKFSKKLVSKCIYIQILKNTNPSLLNQFMAAGGWDLIHLWLTDAVGVKNWALIEELLSLLLLCPVDIERLKSNNCPKFIKGLSKEDSHQDVKLLATRLVEQWLKIVKGEAPPNSVPAQIITETSSTSTTSVSKCEPVTVSEPVPSTASAVSRNSTPVTPISCTTVSSTSENALLKAEPSDQTEPQKKPSVVIVSSSSTMPTTQSPVYKLTIRDGKQVLTKIETDGGNVARVTNVAKPEVVETNGETIKAEVVESVRIESENSDNLEEAAKEEVEEPAKELKVEDKPTKKEGDSTKVNDKENRDAHKKDEKKKSSHHSSSKSSSKHSSSHRSSSSSSSHRSSKSSSSSRHKTSSDKDKDHHHHGSSSKSSSVKKDKEKLKKDQAEKDKATLEKVQGHSLSKSIGKIPKKKSEDEKKDGAKDSAKENKDEKAKKLAQIAEKKNISISIENRKNSQDATSRPKTVKTFNSKFRSTGLEEEVKPPPSRNQVNKKPASNSVLSDKKPVIPSKLPAPTRDTSAPSAEKKIKLSLDPAVVEEKKGSIKLIKPKPMLQESDMFMDALTASTKSKEPRKRKRKTSSSSIKDGPPEAKKQETTFDPVKEVNTPPSSPSATAQPADEKPAVVKPEFKFYQDTLETEEDKVDEKMKLRSSNKKVKIDDDEELKDNVEDNGGSTTPTDDADETNSFEGVDIDVQVAEAIEKDSESALPIKSDVLKSVLVLQKKKGPKKSLKWKTELESIRYFELDETERVNVTKTFTDMKLMEKQNEREAFQMARKLCNEDLMEEKTQWRALVPIDLPPPLVKPGKDSREKDIQYAREKGILQALYLNRSMIPDSAAEPDDERHITTDPKIIPLDDLTGNKESEKDFTNVPWPEPKGMSQTALGHKPPATAMGPFPFHPMYPGNHQAAPILPNQMMVNPPQAIIGMDASQAAPTVAPVPPPTGGGWRTGDGKMVMDVHNSMGMPQAGFPPQSMDGMMPPPGMMAPHMFNPQQQQEKYDEMPYFQGMPLPHGVPGPPAMYGPPPNFQGPRMPPPANRGRGGPPGGWFPRGGMPPPGPRGAAWRGPWRGSGKQPPLCRQFSKNGYCRIGDKCQFLHPPGFAPY